MFSPRRILYALVAVIACAVVSFALMPKTSLSKPKWLTQEFAQSASHRGRESDGAAQAPQTATGVAAPSEQPLTQNPNRIPDSCNVQHPGIAPPLTPDEILERRENLNQREDRARKMLESSNFPQHLVVSALLESNRNIRLDMLSEAVAASPNDVTILWHAFNTCKRSNTDRCPLAEWEERLIELDGQNGHVWMQLAHSRLGHGDAHGALGAIQRAGAAAEYQNFDQETARRVRDAYGTTGLFSRYELYSLSAGQGRAQYVKSRRLFEDMCVDQSQVSIEWAEACLLYANAAIARGDYLESTHSAHRIRKIALGHFDGIEEAEADHNDFKARVAQIEEHMKEHWEKLEGLLLANPQLIEELLQNLSEHGELEGLGRSYAQLMKYLPPEDRPECQPPTDSGVDYPPLSLPD